jgi:hypothetical protein
MYYSLLIDKKAFFKSYKWFFNDEIWESITVTIKSNYNSCDESNIKDVQELRDTLGGKLRKMTNDIQKSVE